MFTNNQNSTNIFINNNNNNTNNNNNNANNTNNYGYNTRNTNNNNTNNNTLLRGTNEQPHQNFIKQLLGFIEDFQKSQELHCIKSILENEYKQTEKDLEICSEHQNSFLFDEQFSKEIKERCLNIKNNNDIIIMEFFNFKEKMSKINSNSLEKDMTKEHEYSQIHEKIRKTKMEILNKFQKVRNARHTEQAKKKINQKTKKQAQIPIARVSLDELSGLVGIVNKELIKQKEEIRVLIKELYDEEL